MGNPTFVSPGQPFQPSAAVWNKLMAIIQRFEGGNSNPGVWAGNVQSVGQRSAQAITTTVYNETGHDFKAFEAVPLGDTNTIPTDGDAEEVEFTTKCTITTEHGRDRHLQWGIALEAIKDEKVGRVLVSGYVPAKITQWHGEDRMVDFDNESEGADDWKLYTSAAGCATIVWMEELEAEAEGWAILHVHGYRSTEPPMWALLDDPLRNDDDEASTEVDATAKFRHSDGTGWNNIPGMFSASRTVKARCFKLLGGVDRQLTGYVQLQADPVGGLWYVMDALSCDEEIPAE